MGLLDVGCVVLGRDQAGRREQWRYAHQDHATSWSRRIPASPGRREASMRETGIRSRRRRTHPVGGGRKRQQGHSYIYTSTDSGVSWTQGNADQQKWVSVASSADGSKLVAAANGVSSIRRWSRARPGRNPGRNKVCSTNWTSVASSADGPSWLRSAAVATSIRRRSPARTGRKQACRTTGPRLRRRRTGSGWSPWREEIHLYLHEFRRDLDAEGCV